MSLALRMLHNLNAVYQNKETGDTGISPVGNTDSLFAGGDENWDEHSDFVDLDNGLENDETGVHSEQDYNAEDAIKEEEGDDDGFIDDLEAEAEAERRKEEGETEEETDEETEETDEETEEETDEETEETDEETEETEEELGDAKEEEVADESPSKFASVAKNLRNRAQAAESKLTRIQGLIKDNEKTVKETLAPLTTKRNALITEHTEAMADGDTARAATIAIELEDVREELREVKSGKGAQLASQKQAANDKVEEVLQGAIETVSSQFEELQQGNPKYNPTIVNMVNAQMRENINKGDGMVRAFVDSVESIVTLMNLAPVGAKKAAPAKKTTPPKKAVEKRKEAAKKTPPKAAGRKSSKSSASKKISQMSEKEFSSEANRKSMEKELGIRFEY